MTANRRKLAIVIGLAAVALLFYSFDKHNHQVSSFDGIPSTPEEVEGLQDGASFGYTPDPEAAEEFLQAMPGGKETLKEQAPELFDGQNKDAVLLYRALNLAYEQRYPGSKWIVGKQLIGDCVSWGWKHGADIRLAVDWRLGATGEWREAATEAIYGGSRVEARGRSSGGWSDGSNGSGAAKWVRGDNGVGGIVFRQDYRGIASDECDLTKYDGKGRAKQWGNYGCGGKDDRGRLDKEAQKHRIRSVALCTSFEEAAVAVQNGYPIPICSGQGFTSTRDKDGFAHASGSWAHCMCIIGVRFDRPGVLILNSWGPNWITGPKWPSDQPDGSFWCDAKTADRMLAGRDSYAVSGYDGFPKRNLKNNQGW